MSRLDRQGGWNEKGSGIAPARMLRVRGKDNFGSSIHGWFKPVLPVEDFLAEYSRAGGAHHLAISYGLSVESVEAFGRMMGRETVMLRCAGGSGLAVSVPGLGQREDLVARGVLAAVILSIGSWRKARSNSARQVILLIFGPPATC